MYELLDAILRLNRLQHGRKHSIMKITGKKNLPYPRAQLWDYLNDVDILKNSIPDCEYVTELSETELEGALFAKVGPIKARFTGKAVRQEMTPPEKCVLKVEGKGGNAGYGSATVVIQFHELSETETQLEYVVDAQLGGKLAQLGSRLIDSTAELMSEKFFNQFAEVVSNDGRPTNNPAAKISILEIIMAFLKNLFNKPQNKES